MDGRLFLWRGLVLAAGLNLWICAALAPLWVIKGASDPTSPITLAYLAITLLLLLVGVVALPRSMLLVALPLALTLGSLLYRTAALSPPGLALLCLISAITYGLAVLKYLALKNRVLASQEIALSPIQATPRSPSRWFPYARLALAMVTGLVLFTAANLAPSVRESLLTHYRGQTALAQALLNAVALLTWVLLVLLQWASPQDKKESIEIAPVRYRKLALHAALVVALVATLMVLWSTGRG